MKNSSALVRIALGLMAGPLARAQMPAQIGDSFLLLSTRGMFLEGDQVIYLAADGTCEMLQYENGEGAPPYPFSPSKAGTYDYQQLTTGPLQASLAPEAALTLNIAGISLAGEIADYVAEDDTGRLTGSIDITGAPVDGLNNFFTLLLHEPNTFLTNVSNRVTLRGSDVAISGFVIQGSQDRLVLIRAVGPGLAPFGVSPVSKTPQLSVYSGQTLVAQGQPWGSVNGYDANAMSFIFGIAGAFPLPAGSSDMAYFGLLSPGTYTVQVTDPSAGTAGGNALVEVYILPYSS